MKAWNHLLDNKIQETQLSALTIADMQNADIHNKNDQLPKNFYL